MLLQAFSLIFIGPDIDTSAGWPGVVEDILSRGIQRRSCINGGGAGFEGKIKRSRITQTRITGHAGMQAPVFVTTFEVI